MCFAQEQTRLDLYPLMFEEKPVTIYFKSATNRTSFSLPEDLILQAAVISVSENGYYTISPLLVEKILTKFPELQDSLASDPTNSAYKRFFDADAVFSMEIFRYQNKAVERAHIFGSDSLNQGEIGLSCKLISTKTNRVLWTFADTFTFEEKIQNNYPVMQPGGFGAGGFHYSQNYAYPEFLKSKEPGFSLLHKSVDVTDDVVLQAACSRFKYNLPYGKYHPSNSKDQKDKIISPHYVRKPFFPLFIADQDSDFIFYK